MATRWMLAGSVLIGAAALWLQHLVLPYTQPFWGLFDYQFDLEVYRAGAWAVLDGRSLYDTKLLGQMDYTYAPVSVFGFAPLALMSIGAARIVWSGAVIVALYLMIMLAFRSLGRPANWSLRMVSLVLVAVSLLLEPIRSTLWYGQVNVFLMLMIAADLVRADHRTPRLVPPGIGAGVAAGIKLTPLLFAVYLAAVRRWRAAAGVVGGFAATVAIGFLALPADSRRYWTDTLFDADRVGVPQVLGNQSIRGLLANLGHTDRPSIALWLVLAVVVGACGMWAAVLAHRRRQELLAISIVGMTSAAVSPMAWGHHWVWLLPILVIGVHHAMRADLRSRTRLLAAAGVAIIVLVAFGWRSHAAHAAWFVNESRPEAYYSGLAYKTGIAGLRWFTYFPYGALYVGVVLATIICCVRTAGSPAAEAGSDDRRSRDVGLTAQC